MLPFHDIETTPVEQPVPSTSSSFFSTNTSNNINNVSNSSRGSNSSRSSSSRGSRSGAGALEDTDTSRLQHKDEQFLNYLDFHQFGDGNDGDDNFNETRLGRDLYLGRGHFDIDMEMNPADHVGLDVSNTDDGKGTTGEGNNNFSADDKPTNNVTDGNGRGTAVTESIQFEHDPIQADSNISSSEDLLAMKGSEAKPPPPSPPSTSKSDSTPTIKNTTKKRTWKKPHDKPKRPLSSYNIYFRESYHQCNFKREVQSSPVQFVLECSTMLCTASKTG